MKSRGGDLNNMKEGYVWSRCICRLSYFFVRFDAFDLLAYLMKAFDTILQLRKLIVKTVFRETNFASLPKTFEPVSPVRIRSPMLLYMR